ncbi:MAG TPA: sterol desaturase family protein [Acidimicrobiia bacterium]|nr:sterol desaturase family protein [Acidimicrobiia bacterium]
MDLTIAAVPAYFGTMGAEYLFLRRRAEQRGPSAADYERRDTITSLTMGVGSLLAPIAASKLLGPVTPGRGRHAKTLLAVAVGTVGVTTIADVVARQAAAPPLDADDGESPSCAETPNRRRRRRIARVARRVAAAGGVASIVTGGIAITTRWAAATKGERLFQHRLIRDLGTGPLAFAAAIAGWDFIYYWNHRFMHESRSLWAIHVVHHSSERYNLSTALRQPVADALGVFLPYGLLALFGIRPSLIAQARSVNLIYQYWFHTDTIRRLGPFERVFNTPSHHRVHHGSNQQYLDQNHGSILIVWDRLFGTFTPEEEPVVYGLTENIDTFNPVRVASHEHAAMLGDVARSSTWRDRLSYVVRGPGWAKARRAATSPTTDEPGTPLLTAR